MQCSVYDAHKLTLSFWHEIKNNKIKMHDKIKKLLPLNETSRNKKAHAIEHQWESCRDIYFA